MDQYLSALKITPLFRDYVWGGGRLRPGERTAEAWVVYEGAVIAEGALSGKTLGEAAAVYGADLLGSRAVEHTGLRFPLLIKLLDCADWLSLQVHPNDEQARRLEGPNHFGKTEAWHVLDAQEEAALLFGLRPGATQHALEEAVRRGGVLDLVQRYQVQAGDTVFIMPGMIHALGPGLLIYEVQQTSNITYRVYDWDRPLTAGRKLHIDESLAVLNPAAEAYIQPRPEFSDGVSHTLVTCPYFTLELLTGETNGATQDTRGESFHTLTLIEGAARVEGDGWAMPLERYETLLVPASTGVYRVIPAGRTSLLKASAQGV